MGRNTLTEEVAMDYLAIVFALASAVVGWRSTVAAPPRWASVGLAVALLALAVTAQFTGITEYTWVNHH